MPETIPSFLSSSAPVIFSAVPASPAVAPATVSGFKSRSRPLEPFISALPVRYWNRWVALLPEPLADIDALKSPLSKGYFSSAKIFEDSKFSSFANILRAVYGAAAEASKNISASPDSEASNREALDIFRRSRDSSAEREMSAFDNKTRASISTSPIFAFARIFLPTFQNAFESFGAKISDFPLAAADVPPVAFASLGRTIFFLPPLSEAAICEASAFGFEKAFARIIASSTTKVFASRFMSIKSESDILSVALVFPRVLFDVYSAEASVILKFSPMGAEISAWTLSSTPSAERVFRLSMRSFADILEASASALSVKLPADTLANFKSPGWESRAGRETIKFASAPPRANCGARIALKNASAVAHSIPPEDMVQFLIFASTFVKSEGMSAAMSVFTETSAKNLSSPTFK